MQICLKTVLHCFPGLECPGRLGLVGCVLTTDDTAGVVCSSLAHALPVLASGLHFIGREEEKHHRTGPNTLQDTWQRREKLLKRKGLQTLHRVRAEGSEKGVKKCK